MFEAAMFPPIWYLFSITIFQAAQSEVFISDCGVSFGILAAFMQTVAEWILSAGKIVVRISNRVPDGAIAGSVYCLIMILIVDGGMAAAGIPSL